MTEFNSQNANVFVDLKSPSIRRAVLEALNCIINLCLSHTRFHTNDLQFIGKPSVKNKPTRPDRNFDSLQQLIESHKPNYEKDYQIKFFCSVVRKCYEFEKIYPVKILTSFSKLKKVIFAFILG